MCMWGILLHHLLSSTCNIQCYPCAHMNEMLPVNLKARDSNTGSTPVDLCYRKANPPLCSSSVLLFFFLPVTALPSHSVLQTFSLFPVCPFLVSSSFFFSPRRLFCFLSCSPPARHLIIAFIFSLPACALNPQFAQYIFLFLFS